MNLPFVGAGFKYGIADKFTKLSKIGFSMEYFLCPTFRDFSAQA